MSEGSKYDFFMNELNSLEKQINIMLKQQKDLLEKNFELNSKVKRLKNENEVLKMQNDEMEEQISSLKTIKKDLLNKDNIDKKELKFKIDNLIKEIDYHLGS